MTDQRPPFRREGEEAHRDPGAYIGNRPVRPTQTTPGGPRRIPSPGHRRSEPPPDVGQREETARDAASADRAAESGGRSAAEGPAAEAGQGGGADDRGGDRGDR